MEEDNKITEEQAEKIARDLDEFVKGTPIEDIQNMPSNNGVLENNNPTEEGETRVINTQINPLTGETIITDTTEAIADDRSFDEKVSDVDPDIPEEPATEEEIGNILNSSDSVLKEIAGDLDFSPEDIKTILDITNRKIRRENFNVYKAFPEAVRKMIDDYLVKEMGPAFTFGNVSQVNSAKNALANSIIETFMNDIQMERARHDFAHELANIYHDSTADIAESSIEYFDERNAAYREAAMKIEDEEKKKRMLDILDRIDQARTLDELKEFAKRCKIKPIELEKPKNRIFDPFLAKYKNSSNNIYDINMCAYVLARNLPERTDKEIYAFLIAFCKYVQNWDITVPVNHAFIYYVLYYCAMLDGDKSNKFKDNAREVIDNLKVRNSGIDFGQISPEELEERLKLIEESKKRREEAAAKAAAEEENEENEEETPSDGDSDDSDSTDS